MFPVSRVVALGGLGNYLAEIYIKWHSDDPSKEI